MELQQQQQQQDGGGEGIVCDELLITFVSLSIPVIRPSSHTHTYSLLVLSGALSLKQRNPKPNPNPYSAPFVKKKRRQLICMSPVCQSHL